MTRDETLKEIERVGVVAVIRTDSAETSVEVCRSLVEGGVTACEITMTVPGAIDAIRTTTRELGDACVIGVGTVLDKETARAAILAGASGYVLKRVKTTDLVDDIRKVGAGESLLDADMTERLFERLRTGPKQDPLLSRLSNQEQVIVDHIAAGLTNRQIAEEMFLAEKTVKNYVSNLLAKMNMSRRSEAAAYVARLEGEKDSAEPAEDWDGT